MSDQPTLGDVSGMFRTFSDVEMVELGKELRIAFLQHPLVLRYLVMQAMMPNSLLLENRIGHQSVCVERSPMQVGYSEGQRAAYKNLLIQAEVIVKGESSNDHTSNTPR